MILKNLFSKKKKLKWIQWKKITRKKNPPNIKKHFFFAKIPEYMEYFVYVTDWYSNSHVTLYTTERVRVRDKGENHHS